MLDTEAHAALTPARRAMSPMLLGLGW